MTQHTRRRIKVERCYQVRPFQPQPHVVSKIRLQGEWLTQWLEPGSYVEVTPSVQRGRRVLILRELCRREASARDNQAPGHPI